MSALGAMSADQQLPEDRRAPQSPDDPGMGESLGEYLEIDTPEGELENEIAPDGGLIVYLDDPEEEQPQGNEGGFFDNLAAVIPKSELSRIATELLEKIDQDKEARKRRMEQYEEGIRRTGMGKDAPGGASFEGASRVVHPGVSEACIDYQARIMKELWPVKGPVKKKINGVVTKEKDSRADRKVAYMNYQLTEQMKEARSVIEKMLSQVPLGGSQFVKLWYDQRLCRPRVAFVSIDKIYLPASAADYQSASRKTYADTLTAIEIRQRVDSGVYVDLGLGRSSMMPDPSKAQQAAAKVEGVDPNPPINTDDEREIYEVEALLEVTDDMADILGYEDGGGLYPYLLTIDVQSKGVYAVYRNWEEDSETFEAINHLFEFPFIPWDGAYAVGIPHVAGGLSAAATGSLRALLDSAFVANSQGGFILKGSGVGGQTKTPEVNEFAEVDAGMGADDIRKRVMQFNTKEPSMVLFQLLGFLVEAQREVVRTSMDESAIDSNANTPVGTQLSRVEEGMVVFSAIHGRAHEAFNRLLAGLHRLNRLYMPETIRVDWAGKEVLARRRDFEGPPDVQPISDPTIYSDQQRMAQINAMQQRSALNPGLYDNRKLEERFLVLMKVPDYEDLLIKPNTPTEMNAVNENLAMVLGRPVVAFPEQNHLAHLQVLLDFMNNPVLGANPIIAPKFLPAAIAHAVEHICYHYVQTTTDLIEHASGMGAGELMSADPQVKQAFDKLLAMTSQHVSGAMVADFQGAMKVLLPALQKVQAMAPKPPSDPAQVALQAATAETQRKGAADAANAQNNQVRNAIMAQRNTVQEQGNELRSQTDITKTAIEGENAKEIAGIRIASGHQAGFSDGASLG